VGENFHGLTNLLGNQLVREGDGEKSWGFYTGFHERLKGEKGFSEENKPELSSNATY